MTNGLIIFLALYVLVWQPAIVWWMLDNTQLYQLAGVNALIFLIALIISAICKPNKSKKVDNTFKLVQKSEEKVSRIENDNGVAIVEVEKKTEVEVESNNDKDQENPEAEKLEEKLDEKTMKETVSIPKIVQPLTWHQTSKKRKREVKWGQRLILLLTLWVAAVIAWTLWEFLGNWWIAIALFLWWILYLVIGKLFDVNWFFNAKKLLTNWLYIILILAWIGYGVYTMQQEDKSFNILPDFTEKVTSYVKSWFNADEEANPEVDLWDVIYVFEWTWEVITNAEDTNNIENVDNTEVENSEKEVADSEALNAENLVEQETIVEDQSSELSPEEEKQQATMWEAIKSILAWTTLSTKTNSTFTYVSKTNELYPYFKTAQEKWMIWTNANPNSNVSCETYITMKWLAEWWNVWNYASSEIKSVYWNKATELWKLNWCQKWKYVTKGNL